MRFAPLCLSLLGVFPLLTLAAPTSHVVHEERAVSTEWTKRNRVPSSTVLIVRIGLAQSNLAKGHDILMDLSDPTSSNYARHMDEAAVLDLFAPPQGAVRETRDWLTSSGISHDRILHTANKSWLIFKASAKEMENLLHTEFYDFKHREDGSVTVACDKYHLPSQIKKHVDFITPGVKLSRRPTRTRRAPLSKTFEKREIPTSTISPSEIKTFNTSTCGQAMIPDCIQALYKYPDATPADAQPGNELGIIEINATYVQDDMDLFFANVYPKILRGTQAEKVLLDGAEMVTRQNKKEFVSSAIAILESNLDFQLAWPIVWPQNITLLDANIDISRSLEIDPTLKFLETVTNVTSLNETTLAKIQSVDQAQPIDTILEAIDGSFCELTNANRTITACGKAKRPNVLSISYGNSESALPAREQVRLCWEFLKLGLQGTSVVISSGDSGVASRVSDGANFKEYCPGPNGKLFDPSFLAGCPYVTAVGGTVFPQGKSLDDPHAEVVALETYPNGTVQYAPGGGFSNRFERPDYQKRVVDAYLRDTKLPFTSYDFRNQSVGADGGVFNRAGRATPDVSAISDRVILAHNGAFLFEGGTSASAPIFAGLITRINGRRIAAGKKPVGFLNPTMYRHPEAFNDVLEGRIPGCGTSGFPAAKGWDAASGLGSPNYPKLLDIFMELP